MKHALERLAGEHAPGPSPSFSVVHFLKALELIAESPVGRSRLSKKVWLGEGAVRTLIDRLKSEGLIAVERAGCTLTRKGENLWKKLHEAFPRKAILEKGRLTLGDFNIAMLVKARGAEVRLGMEQRDAALLAGAMGATTLVFRGGKLVIPPEDRDVAKDFPEAYSRLVAALKPEEDDVVVIGSGESLEKAEFGALAAAWTLIDKLG